MLNKSGCNIFVQGPSKGAGREEKKCLPICVMSEPVCWQDQFNVSMNHVHALAILVSTFHHGKHPSAIDQEDREIFASKGIWKGDATPEQRFEATVGYLGASYDVPSLVDKLLHQLSSKQTIVVNVYDITNASAPITMYGTDVADTGLLHISSLDLGIRYENMRCTADSSRGLHYLGQQSMHLWAINRIEKVEDDYSQMRELKVRAEAADVAKSQFLATVSHEIRTPMNGVLGMLQMLMDTDLDENQMDCAQTAHKSGKDLISVINEVLDQAKIEAGKLELEAVAFDPHAILDEILSLFSEKSNEKGLELAVYASNQVPEVVIGDPKRFRQIITNLVGNSLKFTHDKGHVFISVHLANEVKNPLHIMDAVLREGLNLDQDMSDRTYNTLSGFPVGNRWKSWANFKKLDSTNLTDKPEIIQLLVTVEDTGIGIPTDAQSRIFTPFMQADSSPSRTYGGTGIGLSISKCLVDLMGGEIGFVSEPGIGSTFSFTGNFRKGRNHISGCKWQKCNLFVPEFQGLRALVIDRRKIRAVVTRYHLQRLGMSVDVTSSLKSACSCLSDTCNMSMSTQFAMILIDKDSWDKESSILYTIKKHRQNGIKGDPISFQRFFLLASQFSPRERDELKSAVNRRVAKGVLQKYGAIVTCVEGGRAALKMLKPPHNFDACFMDLQMPEMDGFEATRQIRCMESGLNEKIACGQASAEMFGNISYWHIPILAMTADVTQASSEECRKCGMDGYVSKPFEEEQLFMAVADFFSSGS
ncbi:Signal transduction response regulator, receiver domain [Sesbania bispinosa]|nr:Signal transduction response regulator, receiver domain [Sesbania bispinosa]